MKNNTRYAEKLHRGIVPLHPKSNKEVWLSGKATRCSLGDEGDACQSKNGKTERFRRFFASKATKGRARILLLPQIGGLAELVYCTGLENQRAVKRPKGSNPLASSFLMRCSPAATRADCKSAAIRLRGFESRHLNDGSIVQLVECRSPKPKVGGSSPSASAK